MTTELEKLFRLLVRTVVAKAPDRIHRPMSIGEVTDTHLPYRVARRSLDIHSADEYEVLLVRLFAGEGALVHLQDPAVRERFTAEAASANPDLELLRRERDARFTCWAEALAYALGPGPERAYAPPEPADTDDASADDEPSFGETAGAVPSFDEDEPIGVPVAPHGDVFSSFVPGGGAEGPQCSYCGTALPTSREVNFCPQCGQSQAGARCPECRHDIEPGWRHCVTCGYPLGGG